MVEFLNKAQNAHSILEALDTGLEVKSSGMFGNWKSNWNHMKPQNREKKLRTGTLVSGRCAGQHALRRSDVAFQVYTLNAEFIGGAWERF